MYFNFEKTHLKDNNLMIKTVSSLVETKSIC